MTREQASAELIGWLYMMMVDGVPIHSAKRKALIVALEALQDNHGTMTKQEAIRILKSKMDGSVDTSYEWAEAVRMAIEALEQRPIIHCKDCKFNSGKSKCFNPNSVMLFPDDDDFCSYAERRTEYWEPELTRTITGKIINRTQLMLILYDAGLYQMGPKQRRKRRVKRNEHPRVKRRKN